MRRLVRFCVALFMLCGASPGHAAEFPNKPVRVLVPFAAGGPVDLVTRWLAANLDGLGQPFTIENRTGANTLIAVQGVATAATDGYTLATVTNSIVIQPAINPAWNIDPMRLTPIVHLIDLPLVMMVNPKVLPSGGLKEFLAYAKSNPGKLNFAATGGGDVLMAETFKSAAGIAFEIISYNGVVGASQAVRAGDAHFFTSSAADIPALIASGTFRAVGQISARRFVKFPDMPTLAETGLPGFDFTQWQGLIGPDGMNAAIVRTLNSAFVTALKKPEASKGPIGQCCMTIGSSPEEFRALITGDAAKYKKIAKDANVTIK